jgi:hypothetical protein
MKAIGGYFGFELNKNIEYHHSAIALNTARNAFEYLLIVNKYNKVYIPFYTCEVLLEPLVKLKIDYEFYSINQDFEPIFDFDLMQKNEGFLYTNYFGLKDLFIRKLVKKINNLIIDNAQSFFSIPIKNCDTFYSSRKFFGVPDGSYLYSKNKLEQELEQDFSNQRCQHLLKRIDQSAEDGYLSFLENDSLLKNQPIKKMSQLTKSILCNIDYENCKIIRKQNFENLDNNLRTSNVLKFNLSTIENPMVYPYLMNHNFTE